MLLQTNSYIVPPDKRAEHARLLRRFRQVLTRLGCDHFEVYEQVGSNWNAADVSGRVVQIMRFRDRRHQLAVQAAERNDPGAQAAVAEAIAAASSNGAGEHVEEIHAPEAPQPQQEQPETPPPAQLGGSDDFDLAALLDPHIDPEPGEPRSNANGNPRAGWADDLSLGAALARESGHQPDHVAQ